MSPVKIIQLKKITVFIIHLLLGVLFLYSAYSKIYLIEILENNLVDIGFISWNIAPLLARLLISFEFVLGVLFISQFKLKKITYPIALFTLVFFIFYLLLSIQKYGNTGNCGCFGVQITMTPLQGIVKNIIIIIVILLAYFLQSYTVFSFKYYVVLVSIFSVLSFSIPFVLNPMAINEKGFIPEKIPHNLTLDSLYNEDSIISSQSLELKNNKQIIAYLSMYCVHCKIAAQKLSLFKEKNPKLPIHFILVGNKGLVANFKKESKFKNIDYYFTSNKILMKDTDASFPKIYMVDNSKAVKLCEKYYLLNMDEIEVWLKEK
ncbi:MAG: DoxX family protein [Bacteroidota bacterium]